MPAGDAQRAWFPEMLAELEQYWHPGISWSALAAFCQQMTAFREEIRSSKGIKPVKLDCPACGGKHTMSMNPISIRSALFALKKNLECISEDEFKDLDRNWKRYRKSNGLDAYGMPNQFDVRIPVKSNCSCD